MATRSLGWLSRRIAALSGVTLLALSLGTGLPGAQTSAPYRLGGESVAIWNLAGQVTVEGGRGDEVVVEIARGGRDGERLRVEQGPLGGRQTLRVIFPGNRVVYREARGHKTSLDVGADGRFHDRTWLTGLPLRRRVTIQDRGPGLEAHADLRVRVPAGRTLELSVGAGAVTIANVDGDLRVNASSADVTTRQTRGSLHVDSGSGQLEIADAHGDVIVDTGSGRAYVRGVRGDRLHLDTGSGGLTVDGAEVEELRVDSGSGGVRIAELRAPDIVLDSGSGAVRVDLLPGRLRSLVIDTGSGGVTLGVPPRLDASFEVETGSGGIHIGLPHEIHKRERDVVRGRFGDGSGRIRIETGSGGVRIVPGGGSGARLLRVPGALIGLTFA